MPTAGARPEVISYAGVGKTFVTASDRLEAVRNIDLTVREGEFVTLVGP
jgi:ABC-type Fe3+/spermidine/putrescine transport system ATPase subunit